MYRTAYSVLYRITAFLEVETDIITNITAIPIGWATMQVMRYVEAFKVGKS